MERADMSPSDRTSADNPALYTASAHNTTGPDGESWTEGGLHLQVRSPLAPNVDASPSGTSAEDAPTTNPEELLALAWATCLSASARIVAGENRKVTVRVDVALRKDATNPGFAFAPTAYIAFSDATPDEADAFAAAAHARCPMSKLLTGQGAADIVVEPYVQE